MRELSEKDRVEEVLNLLFGQVTQGLLYFYCAQSLLRAFRRNTLMERSYFFFTVYEAVVREAILTFSKLTREHRESITVYYLFNLVEQNPRLFSSDSPESVQALVADHKGRLDRYGPLFESVREQRDRVVAHLDRRHVNKPSDLFAHSEGVNLTELGECLLEVLDILNVYAGYCGREFRASHLESFISGDVDILLQWFWEHGRPEQWTRPPVF